MAIENIKQKSGILSWSEENIKNVAEVPGVFILRTSPINGAIVNIETSNNLKETLLRIFEEKTNPDVKFFDWYTTNTEEDAKLIKNEWNIKYGLHQ